MTPPIRRVEMRKNVIKKQRDLLLIFSTILFGSIETILGYRSNIYSVLDYLYNVPMLLLPMQEEV